MTLNRELPPIEQAAEALNSRHRYIDMHARRQEAILAGRSLLNAEQVARALSRTVLGLHPEPGPKRDEMIREAAEAIRAAQLGEHA